MTSDGSSLRLYIGGPRELVVGDVSLADEGEWGIDLAEVVKVNALAVPATRRLTYRVMQNELRLLLSFLSDQPGVPLSMRHREFEASARHIKGFVSESFGLGMLTAAVERYYRWKLSDSDLANFDVLPARLASLYPASGVRPDLLFDFSSQGLERRLAGEARGRSTTRPKGVGSGQRSRLAEVVAWSGRNGFHPVTMTWAYSGATHVQVDLFDIQVPEGADAATEGYMEEQYQLMNPPPLFPDEPPQLVRERALGRAAAVATELYETAPQAAPERARRIFGRDVRGDWATANLVTSSNLQFLLGVLDQALDRRQAGAPRHARQVTSQVRDVDPIRIAATQRILVVVARDSPEPPDWSEVMRRIEQPDQ